MKNKKYIYILTGIILIIDQIIKIIINSFMSLHQEITLIKNFFSLYYVRNTGAAFSLLENNTTFLIIITVIYIILINKLIKKETEFSKLTITSLGLILGGIFGNFIDRIIRRGVIDYLAFTIFKYDFPIFNLADIAIVIGLILLLIKFFILDKNTFTEK